MSLIAGARHRYWAFSQQLRRIRLLSAIERRAFAKEVLRTQWHHATRSLPTRGGDPRAAFAGCVAWLLRALRAGGDGGVSLGYFPCDWELGWRPSYPETTGYIIPTLLDHAARTGDASLRELAITAARWETRIQMPSGGVQGGPVCPPDRRREAVFNTGMVLQGWTAAYRETKDSEILAAARRAGNYLVNDLDADGHFRSHGGFVTQDRIKTYNVLCGWAMMRLAEDTGESRYAEAALRNARSALGQQQPNGWFANNDLVDPSRPLTHTIGYTLQGLLEIGVCTSREDLIEAVGNGVEPILSHIRPDGYLPGRFDANWRPAAGSSCLTGSAQIAIVLYRLFQLRGDARHRAAADRLVDCLMRVQCLDSEDENINGAIAGAYPLLGSYMTAGYPNWATKYFADALVLREATRTVAGTQG